MALLKYFAYGSNMHPARLRERISSCRFVDVIESKGWELKCHKRSKDGSGKCNMVATDKTANRVYGVLYELPEEEKANLDAAETVGYGYHDKTIKIPVYGEAFTYLADSEYIDDSLKPYTWYKEFFVEGAKYHGLPEGYIEFLEAIETIQDENATRAENNRQILRSLNYQTGKN